MNWLRARVVRWLLPEIRWQEGLAVARAGRDAEIARLQTEFLRDAGPASEDPDTPDPSPSA